ncbi:MAG: CoA transferase [Proteobacteria bacterium]|nr:CoA transferase [Pseudomonadota bacterium]
MSVLKGMRVIELASERIAFAGKLMADMGADVILVEPPGGDAARGYPPFIDDEPGASRSLFFMHYNTSKRGIVLDLDSEADRETFRQLMATADVLIESEMPGRLESLGLDYPDLQAANPRLVHAAVTAYGRQAPESRLPTTDLTLMAAGGPPWSCGYDDHAIPPIRGWGFQGYQTACHYAFMAILTALLHRFQSGTGQFIDVSMTAALNVTTEAASYTWLVAGETVQRQTGRHAAVAPTGDTQMQCADGRYVNTGVPPRFPAEFGRLLAWITELGMVEDFPEAVFLEMGANWDGPFDLGQVGKDETVTAIFMAGRQALQLIASHVSAYDFFSGCQRAGLSVGVIYSPEEAFEDEHFKARGFQVPVRHHDLDRDIVYPGAPYQLPASPWKISRPAPGLGEHNEEILKLLQP